MALRRSTLEAIGGLSMLAGHVADDSVLGRLVRAQGLDIDPDRAGIELTPATGRARLPAA